ncbi:MAG TPA: CNNM domain-containing protein [Candidatus Hydrogenedentes bacterium]|nr:CNNM domain-containing protein [Candidatus Hydrogenedentota bacterium]
MALFLASVFLALGVSALCSLMEATLLSLTPAQLAAISTRHPRLGGIWRAFKSDIQRPIAVILILNTAAHTIGASIAGSEFDDLFGDRWIWVFSLVFTFLMLQFTEILPKTLGVRFNVFFAGLFANPLSAAITVLSPVLRFIRFMNRPFEGRAAARTEHATVEEIAALVGLARLSNELGAYQERIITRAMRLSRVRVRQVMIPLDQVSFLSTSQTIMDAIVAAHMDAHTRFPVCEGEDRGRVVGYVNFKEMVYFMRTNPNEPNFGGIIRPIAFVDREDTAAELLARFVDQHIHLAMVRGADGTALGMVTLEDIVEELVGEIEDEFDRLPRMCHALSGGVWILGGGLPVAEAARHLGVSLEDIHGVLSDWLLRRLDRAPRPGDTHTAQGLEFTVRRVRRGRVFELSVVRARP